MTTKKKQSQATSREGINFVRALVERHNSTFQEIDPYNDLGNDAYAEFVVDESATGCCVALQIKAGKSYRTPAGGYAFQSNRDHFEYWASHTLPVLAVIFDPETTSAAWVDITALLRSHPQLIANGPYVITAENLLSDASFDHLRQHCLEYRYLLPGDAIGRALESFSTLEDVERCSDGLRALFAFHRNQWATWYYLISCLSNYAGHPVLPHLVSRLCHIPGHPDIFWHKHNVIDDQVRRTALAFMRNRFDRRDALTLLSVIDEGGIDRGTIGQCIHSLVDIMNDAHLIMESVAIEETHSPRVRHSAVLFAVTAAQSISVDCALGVVARISSSLRDDQELGDVLAWLAGDLVEFGWVALY
jgi:hypothetical protein